MLTSSAPSSVAGEQAAVQFGGGYAGLDARRQSLIDNWVGRFNEVTGQKVEPGPFYDTFVSLSAKTTFEAATHALMTTPLTDSSGTRLGDALELVERVDSVAGEVEGASGDRQFRMYVVLEEGALDTLGRVNEFKRAADNTVFHKGFPINFRAQGGPPSIQISIAREDRRADIDVDYRSSSFPAGMFNGHLTSSNSDVRAGNNYDRHNERWVGFQNWWRGFFGIRLQRGDPVEATGDTTMALLNTPRAGRRTIDVMVHDFLTAWLLEGDVVAAMGYVSQRSSACLAQEGDDPSALDRGMAPFRLMARLKAAHEALGKRESLDGLVVGVRLARPGLKVVTQPHHAQFVIYAVPDDIAAAFDCESRLTLGDRRTVRRAYGNYFGATFYIDGRQDHSLALLWARDNGYWKIVSWRADVDEADRPALDAAPDVTIVRTAADASLVGAARDFLESWLVRKNYDRAFGYLSPRSYTCYDLFRSPDQPAASSLEDASRRIRAAMERAGAQVGRASRLDALLLPAEPVHPAVRLMDHPYSRTFTLVSYPNLMAEWADCAARAKEESFPGNIPPEYGGAFGLNIRFQTRSGEGAVLRSLWLRENDAWRVTAYQIELP
jgi:hypothetical protein